MEWDSVHKEVAMKGRTVSACCWFTLSMTAISGSHGAGVTAGSEPDGISAAAVSESRIEVGTTMENHRVGETRRPLTVDDYFAIERLSSPRLSPDGESVAYTVTSTSLDRNASESRIWTVPISGGEPLAMTAAASSASQPRWSPDGEYLSFLSSRGGDDGSDEDPKSQVWVLRRQGGEAMQLTEEEQGVSSYEWAPDGARLVLIMKDPATDDAGKWGKMGGAAAAAPWVVDRLFFKQDYVGYLDHRRDHLYVFYLATKKTSQITSGDYDDAQPAWSPDGRTIAFVSNRTDEPDDNFDSDVWLVDAGNVDRGETIVQVTGRAGVDSSPAWSPDGRRLAYVTTTTSPEFHQYAIDHLAVVSIDGGDRRILTEALDRSVRSPRFMADGSEIQFLVVDSGEVHLGSVPAEGGSVERVIAGARRVIETDARNDTVVALISELHMPGNLFVSQASELRQLTHNNDEHMARIDLALVDNVHFPSRDGTQIEGWIFKPPSFDPELRYPTLLRIHGGPVGQYDFGFNFEAQLFAANGYVVVTPNPRGSAGYGYDFQKATWRAWGVDDTEDVIAGVDHAIALGYADPERLGVGGWSYGGILTNYVITQSDRFKAAISGASVGHWISNYGHDHYMKYYHYEWGLPWETREVWEETSPFNRVDRIVTPTLWMGGEKDWNCPVINSEQMYQAMRALGRADTRLVVYPGQHHSIQLPTYRRDLYERYLAWYDKYLRRSPDEAG